MRAPLASVADVIRFSWVDGPGNRFVVFLQGCNFDCLACHNPQTIPLQSVHARTMSVDDILDGIRDAMPYISGVTVSGGEATVQADVVAALFTAIKADEMLRRLSTFIDSNGSADADTWRALAPVTDGVMVDLKALDRQRHIDLTGEPNDAVLASIVQLHEMGLLYEVRLLIVPTATRERSAKAGSACLEPTAQCGDVSVNDSDEDIRAVAEWLCALDPAVRVKVNQFATHGVRAEARKWPDATAEDVDGYRERLRAAGLTNVV